MDISAWPTEVSDKYEAVRLLGKGSFGSVTLAKSLTGSDEDLVAIKVVGFRKETTRAADRQYARREIDILREIDHPNIVKMLDSW